MRALFSLYTPLLMDERSDTETAGRGAGLACLGAHSAATSACGATPQPLTLLPPPLLSVRAGGAIRAGGW